MNDVAETSCPACAAATAGEPFCPWCGLDQRGTEAAALHGLLRRIGDLDHVVAETTAQRQALWAELTERRWTASRGAPTPSAAVPLDRVAPARAGAEWTVDRVRGVLLWVGAALLAASALTFTAVAWSHLGDGGRATLLAVVTVGLTLTAIALRRRLPASADAFTALSIALALVDWHALRRAGVAAGLSATASWAIGTFTVAVFALALGRVVGARSSRVAVAILLPISGALAVGALASPAWSFALGYALVAAGIAAAWRVIPRAERFTRALLAFEAGLVWSVAAIAVAVAAAGTDTRAQSLGIALVVGALALAPLATMGRGAAPERDAAAATVVVAVLLGAIVTAAGSSLGAQGLVAWATIAGSAACIAAPAGGRRWERPALVAGGAFALPGIVYGSTWALAAVFGPLGWLRNAWTGALDAPARTAFAGADTSETFAAGWPAVWALAAAALALARFGARTARVPVLVGAGVVIVLAALLAPVAGGATALVALITATTLFSVIALGAAEADRRWPDRVFVALPIALIPAVAATGWAAMSRDASIVTVAVALAATMIATAVARSEPVRTAVVAFGGVLVIAAAGVWTAAAVYELAPAGFAVAVAAGLVIVLGVHSRRRAIEGAALEIVGAAGAVVGARMAGASIEWLAGAFTALAPILLVAALGRTRRILYGAAAMAVALAATWAWLAAADVTVVEAYTLPAASAALAAGLILWRDGPARSWLTLGPAIVLLLGPTLVVGIAQDDPLRTAATAVVAFVIVVLGAWKRLQAPLALGSLALLVLAIDTFGPEAARLPRWVPLAAVGALLMWIGTTFERRRDDARRATRRLAHFG